MPQPTHRAPFALRIRWALTWGLRFLSLLFAVGVFCQLARSAYPDWFVTGVEDIPLSRFANTLRHRAGLAWELDLSALNLRDQADDMEFIHRSPLQLWAGKSALTPHAMHADIEKQAGRFSHWQTALIFSPMTNVNDAVAGYRLTIPKPSRWGAFVARLATLRQRLSLGVWLVILATILVVASVWAVDASRASIWADRGCMVVILTLWLVADWPTLTLSPDSLSYCLKYDWGRSVRPPVYPLFLTPFLPCDHPARKSHEPYLVNTPMVDPPVELLGLRWAVRLQKVFLAVALLMLGMALRSYSPPGVAPLFIASLLFLGWMSAETSTVMAETLSQAWLCLAVASSLGWAAGGSRWHLPALTVATTLLFLTRLACVAGILLPLLALWEFRRRPGDIKTRATACALILPIALLFGHVVPIRLVMKQWSLSPYRDEARVIVAIQFADRSDVDRLSSPEARTFLSRVLDRKPAIDAEVRGTRAVEAVDDWEYLGANLYRLAYPIAFDMGFWHGKTGPPNWMFREVADAVLPTKRSANLRMIAASLRYAVCNVSRLGGSAIGLGLWLGGLLLFVVTRRCQPVWPIVALPAVHITSLLVIAMHDRPQARTVHLTEFLFLIASALAVVQFGNGLRTCRFASVWQQQSG